MADIAVGRKQRLRTLENQIRKAAEEIQHNGIQIGNYLCEIRDDELWTDEYDSWSDYLKATADELVGKSFAQANKLIQAAEVSKRIPEKAILDDKNGLGPSHLNELARLVPTVGRGEGGGVDKDYSRLRTQDVARVLKTAAELAGDKSPTVKDIRKAVDQDLGIDRTAKAKETKREREVAELAKRDLFRFLDDLTGRIEVERDKVALVTDEQWEAVSDDRPQLIKRLISACESLLVMLRKDRR